MGHLKSKAGPGLEAGSFDTWQKIADIAGGSMCWYLMRGNMEAA